MTCVRARAEAHLIQNFLQQSVHPKFKTNTFLNSLFRWFILEEEYGTKPLCPPYYNKQFFKRIKDVKNNTSKNIVWMTLKQWYEEIVKIDNITHYKVDPDSPFQLLSCRVEEKYPNVCWERCHRISR